MVIGGGGGGDAVGGGSVDDRVAAAMFDQGFVEVVGGKSYNTLLGKVGT